MPCLQRPIPLSSFIIPGKEAHSKKKTRNNQLEKTILVKTSEFLTFAFFMRRKSVFISSSNINRIYLIAKLLWKAASFVNSACLSLKLVWIYTRNYTGGITLQKQDSSILSIKGNTFGSVFGKKVGYGLRFRFKIPLLSVQEVLTHFIK